MVEVSFVACSTIAAEALVEKANLDTVCQAHGQRLHSLDLQDPLDQRVVLLGVVSGKKVEWKTWAHVVKAEPGLRFCVTK